MFTKTFKRETSSTEQALNIKIKNTMTKETKLQWQKQQDRTEN